MKARLVLLVIGILGLGAGVAVSAVHPFSYTSTTTVQVPPQMALKHARQVDGVQFTPVTNQLTELTVTASTANQAEGDADLAAKAYLRHLAFRVSRLHRSAGYRAKLVNRSAILDPPTAGQPHRSLLLGGVLGLAAGLVLGFLVLTISGISGRRLKPAAA